MKNIITSAIVAVSLLLLPTKIFAQDYYYDDYKYSYSSHGNYKMIRVGVRVGVGQSTYSGLSDKHYTTLPGTNIEVQNFGANNKLSLDVGAVVQGESFSNMLTQAEFTLSTMGTGLKNTYYVDNGGNRKSLKSINSYNLNMSLYYGKRIDLSYDGKVKLVLAGGGFFSIDSGILASESRKERYSSSKSFDEYGSSLSDRGLNTEEAELNILDMDIGYCLMAGFDISNVQIAAQFHQGFLNYMDDSVDAAGKNRMFKVAVTYFFRPR